MKECLLSTSNNKKKEDKLDKIFWIDLEMTGLDVYKEVIIEVGVILTDLNFNKLTTYHAVINQPQRYLDNMDEWNQKHHRASGLLEKIPRGKNQSQVESELIELCNEYFHNQRPVIAGNSIAQDRRFIDHHMKKFSQKLHYRMLDITSWKLIFKYKYNLEPEKKDSHRALDDIQESIDELKHYLSYIQIPS